MGFNWLDFGYELAMLIVSVAFSLLIGALVFKRYLAPQITGTLEEAQETITNLAKLGGVKSQEFKSSKKIEKLVAEDFIKKQIPELELVKTFVSPSTWEEIEDTIDNNPEAVIQLWEKYGHYFTNNGAGEKENTYDFE